VAIGLGGYGTIVVLMPTVEVLRKLHAPQVAAVIQLVETVTTAVGHRPLSDQQWLDLTRGGRGEVDAVLISDGPDIVGYCPITHGNDTWTIEVVVTPLLAPSAAAALTDQLVEAALARVGALGGGQVHWWVFEPDDTTVALAERHAMTAGRTLHQMRAPLPLRMAAGDPVVVRPFRIGEDELAWLTVNNAAFAGHPEQGGWTLDTVRQREAEDWFEPEGFLLHHRDGRLAAFCWTKLHRDEDPVLGEIYVIAVHPDFHGLGLGKAMTVAGLESIAARGVTQSMLYVDRDSPAAFDMYRHLGFTVHRTDRAFVGEIAAIGDLDGAAT